jgi:hypothetical protein
VTENGEPLDSRLARQARNEAQVREINERIESFDKSLEEQGYSDGLMTFEFIANAAPAREMPQAARTRLR